VTNLVDFLDQAEKELGRIPRAMAALLPPPLLEITHDGYGRGVWAKIPSEAANAD